MPNPPKSEPRPRPFLLRTGTLLFVAVLALRLWVLLRLTRSPLLLPAHGDMHFYDDWARNILAGHANSGLAFYGLPGYAYLLAFFYKVFGINPFMPAFFQAIADAMVAVLIYQLTKFAANNLRPPIVGSPVTAAKTSIIGLIAAAGWAFYVPAEAYSVVLMPTIWFVLVFWFVVDRVARGDRLSSITCFALALLIGLTATGVATIFAVVPILIVRLIADRISSSWPAVILKLPALVCGLALGTAPCWVHNYYVARDPVFLSAHSGINFWIGNNPEANGYPRFPPGLRAGQAAMLQDSINQAEAVAGRPLKRADVSAYWSAKAKEYIAHDFDDWLRLLARKTRNFWSAFQYDDLSVITSLREQGVILPGLYFGIVAALGVPGICLGWKFAPQSRWMIVAILLAMIALLPVFITERYRLAAVPGLLVFAALGLSIFWDMNISGRLRGAALYLFFLAAATAVVAWPQRTSSLWALDAYNSGWQALESGDLNLAEQKLALAHAYVPDNSETLFALGNLRLAQKNEADADLFYRAVLKLDPNHKGALNNLGVIALETKRYDNAETWLRRASAVDPRSAKTHFLLAKALLGENEAPGAEKEIDAALALQSDQPEFKSLKDQITLSTNPAPQ